MIDPVFQTSPVSHRISCAECRSSFKYIDVKFSISGSSYITAPDCIPTLGRQIHL